VGNDEADNREIARESMPGHTLSTHYFEGGSRHFGKMLRVWLNGWEIGCLDASTLSRVHLSQSIAPPAIIMLELNQHWSMHSHVWTCFM
jgi:hypothetical protein